MNTLKRRLGDIWTDVRHGKDVELYITIPVAAIVIILNLLDAVPGSLVSALTLAVLTLLTVALLKLRKQSDQLQAAVDQVRQPNDLATRFFWPEHDVEEVKRLIRASREEVWLWGSTLSMHVSELAPYLEEAISAGLRVKVLLIKPEPSAAITMAALRAGHPNEEELGHELSSNLFKLRQAAGRLEQLAAVQPCGRLEVRVLDYLAPYTLYAYDPGLWSGRLDMRLGGLRTQHRFRPGFTLSPTSDGQWYAHFKEQFEAGWKMGMVEIIAPETSVTM